MGIALWVVLAGVVWRSDVQGSFPRGDTAVEQSEQTRAGAPLWLTIDAIGVDAPIVPVGLTPSGAMDVPYYADDVGWYSLGVTPGQPGSAVLAGHYDTVLRTPGVFWNLKDLAPGDLVRIDDAHGETRVFRVESSSVIDPSEAQIEELFGSGTEPLLRLITCDGPLTEEDGYAQRFIVTARFVEEPVTPENESERY